nr:immunoglobulin heavy chain junction region [Mus musculus]
CARPLYEYAMDYW